MKPALSRLPLVALLAMVSSAPVVQPMSPGARLGHAMAYDERLRRVVLADGAWPQDSAGGDLWSWSGTAWERIGADGPRGLSMGAIAFDARRERIVSYGGVRAGQATAQLVEWEGARPVLRDTTAGARFHHAIAWDASRSCLVMYGGAVGRTWDGDTWEWDGARWHRLSVPGPGPRAAFRMVYDSRRREVVLFGGAGPPRTDGAPQEYFGDTWVWNGVSWRKASDAGPAGRRDYSMAYDRRQGVVLLYGGASGSGAATERYADMWKWDDGRWVEIPLAMPNPGHRYVSAMAYDAARDRTVLYGGYGCPEPQNCGVLGDSWEWNGSRWALR